MDNWSNNSIQFPRLIAEILANGGFTPTLIAELAEAMDLQPSEVWQIIDRAQSEWDRIKEVV